MLVGEISESDEQMRIIVRIAEMPDANMRLGRDLHPSQRRDLFTNQVGISRKIASSVIQSIPVSIRPSQLRLSQPVPMKIIFKVVPSAPDSQKTHSIAAFSSWKRGGGSVPSSRLAWTALANAHCMAARLGIVPSGKAFPGEELCRQGSCN